MILTWDEIQTVIGISAGIFVSVYFVYLILKPCYKITNLEKGEDEKTNLEELPPLKGYLDRKSHISSK